MYDQMQEIAARELQFLAKTYDGLNKLIVSTKNRITAINSDMIFENDSILNGARDKKGNEKSQGLEQVKGRISRQITKLLRLFPIWEKWLKDVPGIGPDIASNLILSYYFKFSPICKHCGAEYGHNDDGVMNKECPKCGKKASGEGVLQTIIKRKDFPTISKWWVYMGRNVVDGKMPKRKKGVKSNWSSRRRTVTWQIGQQFNRQSADNPYKTYLLERREKRLKTHPGASKGHNLNMASNEAVKLFLSHFWHVARRLEGKEVYGPWVEVIGGHTNIIPPYYWDDSEYWMCGNCGPVKVDSQMLA